MRKANLQMVRALILVLAGCPAGRAAVPSCEKLAELVLPKATVTMAQSVGAGAFEPPMAPGVTKAPNREPFRNLPAFCRVAATLAPSSDSEIKMETWLPLSGWNGKFQGVGNGGWAGSISYGALAGALTRGYAAASTDTGHTGGSGSFALGHPEKLVDFAYRAVHEMTVKSKVILKAFYGSGPKLSYWVGCSNGGRQALQEAQRFPSDYDGIVAGAPANFWTHLMSSHLWIAKAVHQDETSYIPPEKYAWIHKALLHACDALDGITDGVLDDPRCCRFDPKVLECKGADTGDCLTSSQVEAARKIYGSAKIPQTGKEIFPGLERGSELGWAGLAGPKPFSVSLDYFKYVVARNGIRWVKLPVPAPPEQLSELTACFERALSPKTRVIHLSHVTFSTGQIYPVREIGRLARTKGILSIVDGAHAFAHRVRWQRFRHPGNPQHIYDSPGD